jgi:hypothetical protein
VRRAMKRRFLSFFGLLAFALESELLCSFTVGTIVVHEWMTRPNAFGDDASAWYSQAPTVRSEGEEARVW